MKKNHLSDKYELDDFDWDIDFNIDFKFSLYEYLLAAIYAVFVIPFELIWKLTQKLIPHPAEVRMLKKQRIRSYHQVERSQATGPCCRWPRATSRRLISGHHS